MERVLANWHATYYLPLVLLCCAIYSLLKLYVNRGVEYRTHFIIYILSVLILFVITDFATYAFVGPTPKVDRFIELLNLLFALIETYVFSSFVNSIIRTPLIRKFSLILQLSTFCILVGGIIYLFTSRKLSDFDVVSNLFYTIQLLLLTFPGMWYIYEIHAGRAPYNHKNLILVLCFVGYCLLSVPFFSIATWLGTVYAEGYFILFSLHFFCLACLCLALGFYSQSIQLGDSRGLLYKIKSKLLGSTFRKELREKHLKPLRLS